MRVLSVGEDPATVDYSKAPDGVDQTYIQDGIDGAIAEMKARGWDARMCIVPPEIDTAVAILSQMLTEEPVDVLLIGGGWRMPPDRLELFEALMNAARRSAPGARLAFDNDPHDGPDAVTRQLST